MAIDFKAFDEQGIDPFDAPTPGQSLTSSPEQPAPYERPPQHVDLTEALEDLYFRMTEEGVYEDLLTQLREGMPVSMLTQVTLFKGFQSGLWTTDLMLLLIEPVMYLIVFLADQAGIDPVMISKEEDALIGEEDDPAMEKLVTEDIKRMTPKDLKSKGFSEKVTTSLLAPKAKG